MFSIASINNYVKTNELKLSSNVTKNKHKEVSKNNHEISQKDLIEKTNIPKSKSLSNIKFVDYSNKEHEVKRMFKIGVERTGGAILGGTLGSLTGLALGGVGVILTPENSVAGAVTFVTSSLSGLGVGVYAGITGNIPKALNIASGVSMGLVAGNLINIPFGASFVKNEVQTGIIVASALIGGIYGAISDND
ncbi:MAG: hypothetical protein U0354_17440 [Candidatus Sericytochromatia bacterium]